MGQFLLTTLLLALFLAACVWAIIQKIRGALPARSSESEDASLIPVKVSETGKMRAALDLMMGQGGTGSFVIFEEPRSGKFVQFAGSKSEDLLLDLPGQPLGENEMARAREFFKHLGIDGPAESETFDPKGRPGGKLTTFQMTLGDDTYRAGGLAAGIFREVYQFPPDTALTARVNLET